MIEVTEIHLFAVMGVLLTLLGFRLYNEHDGQINSASWFLWVIGDVLEAGSYFVMTGEDFIKNAVPMAFAVGSCVTFLIALLRRRFSIPDVKDQVIVGIDLSITVGWWQAYFAAAAANIMFVSTELISFIPLYRGVLAGKEKELIRPWLFWSAGDAFFLATVLALPHSLEETIYPIVAITAHLLVVVCIIVRVLISRVPQ